MTANSSATSFHAPAPGVSRGVTLAIVAALSGPLIDVFSKLAGDVIPAVEVTAVRFLVQAILMAPFLFMLKGHPPASRRNMHFLHALRGALLTLAMICFVTTLRYMEVADVIAIFFVEPVMLTVLGAVFLKETVGWRRYTACAVGFGGTLLVIQPSFQEVGAVALLPVIAALAIAIFSLLSRMLAQRESPFFTQFRTSLWGLGFSVAIMALAWMTGFESASPVMPDAAHIGYMIGTGVMAAFAGTVSVFSFRYAPASTLAPLQYLEIVSATAVGWLVFGDFPDGVKWLGIAIIVASGLYIIWRERRVNARIVTAVEETATP